MNLANWTKSAPTRLPLRMDVKGGEATVTRPVSAEDMEFAQHVRAMVGSSGQEPDPHFFALVMDDEEEAAKAVASLDWRTASDVDLRTALALWEQARKRLSDWQSWLDRHEKALAEAERREAEQKLDKPTPPDRMAAD